ncbi:hypothetical protein COJ85_04085 [Bacillus sp. AFS076308]|nr:hypothetical protein COJ85_04085 [Bacillus sp. AFS076308]PGV49563.1 hypothetical protein COD92_21505 [Bacillus sp. AFS037270]
MERYEDKGYYLFESQEMTENSILYEHTGASYLVQNNTDFSPHDHRMKQAFLGEKIVYKTVYKYTNKFTRL